MENYVGVLLFRATGESEDDHPLYEESFVLLTAEDEETAWAKASSHGREREHSYRNDDGELISWKLEQVVDVCLAVDDEIGDGAELYSRFFRDLTAYRAFEPLLDGEPL
ncbi:MAG: DUF4288 domain-containing protein [Pseudonocardiaceae bacterium]|nr:DUF4288 domain-containing protein [Pseudonocardiaceae bacterium]